MLLIFDWDGTLADSELHIVTALQSAARSLAWAPRTHLQSSVVIGLGLREAAQQLYPGKSVGDIEQFCTHYRNSFRALADSTFSLRLFEQAESTLLELHRRGHNLAVATGKSRAGLDRALGESGVSALFCATRTADESCSKPNPAMLHDILRATAALPADAVMIGDTSFDMQMASSIGMPRVAATYGVHSAETLARFEPVWTIDRIDELLAWPGLQ